jgi:WD40 repeat protein
VELRWTISKWPPDSRQKLYTQILSAAITTLLFLFEKVQWNREVVTFHWCDEILCLSNGKYGNIEIHKTGIPFVSIWKGGRIYLWNGNYSEICLCAHLFTKHANALWKIIWKYSQYVSISWKHRLAELCVNQTWRTFV